MATAALVGKVYMKVGRSSALWLACSFVLFLLLALTACGSGGGEQAQSDGEDKSSEQAVKEDVAEAPEEAKMESKALPKSGEEGKALPKAAPGGGQPVPDAAGLSEGQDAQDFDRRVIRSADLGIRAEDVRESAAEAQQAAARLGGNVLSSEINEDAGSVSADLVLSVPSERLVEALEELRGLGTEVTTDTVEGEDVTEEFVDLESRERNLLAAEESLLELYDQSTSVQDTLTVLRELTQVRDQIERVQGRIQYLEQRTDFSQITLDIQPATGADSGSRPAWDPAGIASRAWEASLSVLQTAAGVVISVLVFGWWLIPLLVVGLVLWLRRRNRKKNPPEEPH